MKPLPDEGEEARASAPRPFRAMAAGNDSLSARDYARLCAMVYDEAGIRLGPDRKTMLEVRLRRRLHALGIDSCSSYCAWLFSPEGRRDETVPFIDAVTTNKTDFFREPRHFDELAERVLPELEIHTAGRPLLVWSAGCSTGEEPYTLAIVLREYARAHPAFRFGILATDISASVLAKAEAGVYPKAAADPIPPDLRRKYLMRGRDARADRVRVVPELRRLVEFRRLNLMDQDYGLSDPPGAIFCRNVIIYFDRPTQEKILRRLALCLAPWGYLFVGHSESLHGMQLPLAPVAPALYRRIHGAP